jgi:hypothetical protein
MKEPFQIKCITFTPAILLILTAVAMHTSAADFPLTVEHTVFFSRANLNFDRIMDYDLIKLEGSNYLSAIGLPMLPMKTIHLALPAGMKTERVRIISIESEKIDGEFSIFPAQPPIEISRSDDNIAFVEPDPVIYNSSTPYPVETVRLIRQYDLAGQAIAEIRVAPIRFIPAEKRIELITSVTFAVEGDYGYRYGDYLPDRITERGRQLYLQRLKEIVVNDADIAPAKGSPLSRQSGLLPPGGPYDHLIITSDADGAYYQPLAKWHTRKGVRDTVITLTYIYANYDGADEKEKIRNFIIDAHQNWGTLYILLGGERETIPFEYRNYDGTSVPSDAYYGDYDDDWEYELFVGRISAEGPTEIGRFVNRVINYETDPQIVDFPIVYEYPLYITLVGMDLTVASLPPYYTLTACEDLKDSIVTAYIPSRFIVTEIYDSFSENHRDEFIKALNIGQNLINHCDHSFYSVMGVGDINHGWYITWEDVFTLTNYHRYSTIYSLGCHANRMDVNDAISEYFVFGTDSTGAVAFTGNTRSGWFYVGDPFSLSSELDLHWWEGLFAHNKYRLGEALAYTKSVSNVQSQHPYSEWTLNLLGEPEMPLWTDMPGLFAVSHPEQIPALPQQFDVHVEGAGGTVVGDALVCLWKGSEIYEREFSDNDGNAGFNIYPTTCGPVYVTVTKQNFIPYRGEAEVTGNVPPVCQVPNDTAILQCSPTEIILPVGCTDPDGNLAYGPELVRGVGQIIGDYWHYNPYGDDSVTVIIRCSDSLEYYCESSFTVLIDINDPPVWQVPNDTAIAHRESPEEICLPIFADDPNGNIEECGVLAGPGGLTDGCWRYTPGGDEFIEVTVRAVDDCDAFCEASFCIDYDVLICGDANNDNELNMLDVLYEISYLYKGGLPPQPESAGDINGDTAINMLDILYLISCLYKNGPAPFCP